MPGRDWLNKAIATFSGKNKPTGDQPSPTQDDRQGWRSSNGIHSESRTPGTFDRSPARSRSPAPGLSLPVAQVRQDADETVAAPANDDAETTARSESHQDAHGMGSVPKINLEAPVSTATNTAFPLFDANGGSSTTSFDQPVRSQVYPDLGANNDTRVISLTAGVRGSMIECSSQPIALHNEEIYDALSYTWGDDALSHLITVNGCPVRIRKTLFDALEALRDLGVTKLWVDNLSINQEDTTDKDRQIGKMHIIYSQVSKVYAWVGSNASRLRQTGDGATHEPAVPFLGQALSGPENANAAELRSAYDVLKQPYWTRCWIIQELCTAQDARVLYGSSQAELATFWRNFKLLNPVLDLEPSLTGHFDSLLRFQEQESTHSRDPQMPLINALLFTRHAKAKIPVDKIFAIMNLAHDSNRLVPTPNYRQPYNTIYHKLAHNMIQLQEHVAIILLARRAPNNAADQARPQTPTVPSGSTLSRTATTLAPSPNNGRHQRHRSLSSHDVRILAGRLPSWVPRWSSLDDPLPRWIVESVKMKRPKALVNNVGLKIGYVGPTLCIQGIHLDNVESVSAMYGSENEGYTVASPTGPADHPNEKSFLDSIDVVKKLWYAILAPVHAEEGTQVPDHTHKCGNANCHNADEGYAVASVLLSWKDSTRIKRDAIKRWLESNRNMRIGKKSLVEWLGGVQSNLRVPSKRLSRHESFCPFDTEAHTLDDGIGKLNKLKMRLAVTTRCDIKAVYRETRPDDVIFRLDGCPLPVILREEKSNVPELSAEASNHSARTEDLAAQHPDTEDDTEADAATDGDISPAEPPSPRRFRRADTLAQSGLADAVRAVDKWQFVGEVYQEVVGKDARDLDAVWKDKRNGWKTKDFSLTEQSKWLYCRIT